MNGTQFLVKVREQEPDTVIMILSGHADLADTIAAVNDGHIYFRPSIEYARLVARGASRESAGTALRAPQFAFPPSVLRDLLSLSTAANERIVRQIRLADLMVGMILDKDLVSPKGIRLVPSGAKVTRTLMIRLTSIASGVGVAEPFRVRAGI
ncbi:MAG: hypothetical protein ABI356_01775 [Steroidobacteraceae bacterium]